MVLHQRRKHSPVRKANVAQYAESRRHTYMSDFYSPTTFLAIQGSAAGWFGTWRRRGREAAWGTGAVALAPIVSSHQRDSPLRRVPRSWWSQSLHHHRRRLGPLSCAVLRSAVPITSEQNTKNKRICAYVFSHSPFSHSPTQSSEARTESLEGGGQLEKVEHREQQPQCHLQVALHNL